MIKYIDEVFWRSDRDVADLDLMIDGERVFVRAEVDKSIGGEYSSIDEYTFALNKSEYISFLHVHCKSDVLLTSCVIRILDGLKNHPVFNGLKTSAYNNLRRYIGSDKISKIDGSVCVNTHTDPEDLLNHLNWWLWETTGVVPEIPNHKRAKNIFGRLRRNDWYRISNNVLRRFQDRYNIEKVKIGGWGLATYRDFELGKEAGFEVVQTRF